MLHARASGRAVESHTAPPMLGRFEFFLGLPCCELNQTIEYRIRPRTDITCSQGLALGESNRPCSAHCQGR